MGRTPPSRKLQRMPATLRKMLTLRRPPAPVAWVIAAMLLLQAAVPLLAVFSAQAQGRVVAEVCSVYGVRTVNIDIDPAPAQDAPKAHGSEHCVLTPLLTASFGAPPMAAVLLHAPAPLRVFHPAGHLTPPDATRSWVAARKHGPPLNA
jgi:hypothetical protein